MNFSTKDKFCRKCQATLPLIASFTALIPGNCQNCGPVEVKEKENSFLDITSFEKKANGLSNKESIILGMKIKFTFSLVTVVAILTFLQDNGLMLEDDCFEFNTEYHKAFPLNDRTCLSFYSDYLRPYMEKLAPKGYKFDYKDDHYQFVKE